ncbi:MAG: hypothetical protein RQ864_12745 [Lutibacter sp.]|nr:hypothetical protein [Lutibacter sp.]MDT8418666.1 hypothetical protein [Lutibacter sp.]
MKIKNAYLAISIFVVISGILLSLIYRPYVYRNNIFDFGFADVIGSFVSVIGFCTFVWSINNNSNKKKNIQIIIATIIYSIVWEFFGLIGVWGTFDWKDIGAAIISGIFTYFIKNIVEIKFADS